MRFNVLICPVVNTAKSDSVAGSANNSKVLENKSVVCFTSYFLLTHSLDTLEKTPIKKFKRFV